MFLFVFSFHWPLPCAPDSPGSGGQMRCYTRCMRRTLTWFLRCVCVRLCVCVCVCVCVFSVCVCVCVYSGQFVAISRSSVVPNFVTRLRLAPRTHFMSWRCLSDVSSSLTGSTKSQPSTARNQRREMRLICIVVDPAWRPLSLPSWDLA